MDYNVANKLLEVGQTFRIEYPFFSYEEVKTGNVNATYKVSYIRANDSGFAEIKNYLIQRINTVAFTDPIKLMDNIDRVTTFLHEKDPDALYLHFHHTADHKNYILDNSGFWRLCNYVPSVTFDTVDDVNIVKSAGEAFGEFQMMLSDFDVNQLHYTIPDFHDTRKRYRQFEAAIRENAAGRADEVAQEIEWLLSYEDLACTLTDMHNEGKLPLRVTHNDTKINNVLFDEKTHRPLVVIDLDTVMPGLVGHDFGDAIRFAANFTEEDSTELDKTGLNLNTFWAFAEGFLSKTAATLTENEIDTLGISCFALACELATRFLADYLNGDKYFVVKKDKHNLLRARCQIQLAKDMLTKLHAMDAICRECCNRYRK